MKKPLMVMTFFLLLVKAGYSSGPVVGMTLGTPGLVNMNMGYYGDVMGISFSLSFLHMLEAWADQESDSTTSEVRDDSGLSYALLQFNLDCKIVDRGNLVFAASAAGGTICLSDNNNVEKDITIFYAGPCIHFIWSGFFIELGAAYARDFSAKFEEEKTSIIPLVQLGYMVTY